MKYIFLTAIASLLFLNGCYTVLWHPGKDVSSDNYYDDVNIYIGPSFYSYHYHYYYNQPWWNDVTSPSVDRTAERTKLRETSGDRAEPTRVPERINIPGTPRPLPPPTISEPSTGSSNSNTTTSTGNDSSRNKSSSNDDSKNLRNNDGNRSKEPGKR